MKWTVCSVFDSAVGVYSPPFCVRALGEGIRGFMQEAKSEKSKISLSPNDYSLFHLGEFDDEAAVFTPLAAPRRIVSAHEMSPLEP